MFQVYPDLEVSFVISEEASICNALSKTVELLEGNTALISQHYYGCIFHELTAFQLADRHPSLQVCHFFLGGIIILNHLWNFGCCKNVNMYLVSITPLVVAYLDHNITKKKIFGPQ